MSNAPDPAADLLASLRAHSGKNSPATGINRQSYPFSPDAVKSPQLLDARLRSPPRASSSASVDKMSRTTTPGQQGAPDLLGLLKFGQPASSPQPSTQQQTPSHSHSNQERPKVGSVHGRGVSASDLVSSIVGSPLATPPPRERVASPSSASTHQNSLLKLLNQTASTSTPVKKTDEPNDPNRLAQDLKQTSLDEQQAARASLSPSRSQQSPIHVFGSGENAPLSFEPHTSSKGSPLNPDGLHSYVNPFEEQTSLSPHIKKRRVSPLPDARKNSRRSKSPSPAAGSSVSQDKLTSAGKDVLQSIDTNIPNPPKDGRSHVEALMGIGAPSRNTETVARALNEVGDQVDRQVSIALAEAENKNVPVKKEHGQTIIDADLKAISEHIHDAATKPKPRKYDMEDQDALKQTVSSPRIASAVKPSDEQTKADLQNAEATNRQVDPPAPDQQAVARRVKVYQFPMRPFVSIDLTQKEAPDMILREQSDFPVARFKKDFDQTDRTLATATGDFIVYAVPKNTGGVRVIEQDNGTSSMVFPDTQDRIFNVAISTEAAGSKRGPQNVIATGVSGTVYWTTVALPGTQLSQEEMQAKSLHFPPTPASSDSTSGGQLKTRAKKSSRHPEFFAVGRGKSIQIVFPTHASSSEYLGDGCVIDTEKYFASRNLKIVTGKAGKDFTFSEDDTVIVTLDKAGKLRLWDIRDLVHSENESVSRIAPIEVKAPILTFPTANVSEKSWPTSVMFVDKLRPYTKGTALRYIIVGMKQNHTLQLWDLCLGKAVQELNFSHVNETDAICSVAYHPSSGVIVVGHPTRNSIYFIHLSAPKYNLPVMSQAKFAQRSANKDASLPKAEATAIMSGMREYSLADKGQLRSVELTQSSNDSPNSSDGDEEPPLFELIVMHSKGVLCLGVKKEDLGLSAENKVLYPVDAEKEGLIVIKDLREPAINPASEPSTLSLNGEAQATASPTKELSTTPSRENLKAERAQTATPNKDAEKKKGKKGPVAEAPTSEKIVPKAPSPPPASESYANAVQKGQNTKQQTAPEVVRPHLSKNASLNAPELVPVTSESHQTRPKQNADSVSVGISGDFLNKEIKKIEQSVSSEFSRVLKKELDVLYKQIAEDKRIQDAAGAAKQDAILRLVSSTLGDNVEKSLSRIVQAGIKEEVLPALKESSTTSINKQLSTTISQHLKSTVPAAIKESLSDSLSAALQSTEMIKIAAEKVSQTISGHVEREISNSLNKTILPTFQDLALSISQKISGETERRVRDQLQQAENQRRSDSAKIEHLTTLVSGLSEMVHTMAAAQSEFQAEILKFHQKAAERGSHVPGTEAQGHSPTPSESASMHVSPEQEEVDGITTLMNEGRCEEATILVGFV